MYPYGTVSDSNLPRLFSLPINVSHMELCDTSAIPLSPPHPSLHLLIHPALSCPHTLHMTHPDDSTPPHPLPPHAHAHAHTSLYYLSWLTLTEKHRKVLVL